MTAPLDVAALRALEQAATPGPWTSTWDTPIGPPPAGDDSDLPAIVSEAIPDDGSDGAYMRRFVVGLLRYDGYHAGCNRENAALIAAARNALPALLDAYDVLTTVTRERDAAHELRRACNATSMAAFKRIATAIGDSEPETLASGDVLASLVEHVTRERDEARAEAVAQAEIVGRSIAEHDQLRSDLASARQARAAWTRLRRAMDYRYEPPPGLTAAFIEQAMALLKLESPR